MGNGRALSFDLFRSSFSLELWRLLYAVLFPEDLTIMLGGESEETRTAFLMSCEGSCITPGLCTVALCLCEKQELFAV